MSDDPQDPRYWLCIKTNPNAKTSGRFPQVSAVTALFPPKMLKTGEFDHLEETLTPTTTTTPTPPKNSSKRQKSFVHDFASKVNNTFVCSVKNNGRSN